MSIWYKSFTIEDINHREVKNMIDHVDIKFIEIGDDYLVGTMPVDHRTRQPMGILHGGASVVLAETLGSTASAYCLDQEKYTCVGLDINSNHIRAVQSGLVTGVARPFHIGRTTHVWEIKVESEEGKLVNISRLTMAILEKK